nr:MAG TPA: hypothetical protein [Caudoviricetes sp.]
MRGQKYKKSSHLPNDSSFFIVLKENRPKFTSQTARLTQH